MLQPRIQAWFFCFLDGKRRDMIEGNGILNAVLLAKAGETKAPSVKQLAPRRNHREK
jgi:hypothetical protein